MEWALALLRAPGERHALRQRPLPDGVDTLLGIAAETDAAALAPTAARWGEPPERLREAARFYAREILFHPQADAYRVLGLRPDADAEAIKAHHRLLQRWLHPDRRHAEDDSVFAARVNTAWNHLRTPERRQAYDRARASDRVPEVVDSGELARLNDWRMAVPQGPPPLPAWRRRAPVYALLLACLVLVWMGVRDAATQPDLTVWDGAATGQEEAGPVFKLPERDRVADAAPRTERPSRATARAPRTPVHSAKSADIPAPTQAASPESPRSGSQEPIAGMTDAEVAAVPADADPRDASRSPPPPPATVAALPPPQELPERRIVAAPAPRPLPPVVQSPAITLAPSAPAPADADAQAAFARVQQARDVGEQLVRYMSAVRGIPPPIWNSPAIQSSADLLRQDLHRDGRQRLGKPAWTIGEKAAAVSIPTGPDASRLQADLVYREGRWLVVGVSVEHAP